VFKRSWRGVTRSVGPLTLGLLAVFVCGILASCVTMQNTAVIPPTIPGAEFVGNEECAACHEDTAKSFARSAHARIYVADAGVEDSSGCESCHGPGSMHVDADDGEKAATIVNPGESADQCFRCHMDTEAQFNMPYSHPVKNGKVTCNDCHDPHGKDAKKSAKLAISRMNDTCRGCHKEQTRPHLYEHEALSDGCVTCHSPHGSVNKKMLIENDMNLCLKCHASVMSKDSAIEVGTRNHAGYAGRANCWNGGCHTAVHGSSVDSHLRY
jgi:predicted CXXCH cytochrome family protein